MTTTPMNPEPSAVDVALEQQAVTAIEKNTEVIEAQANAAVAEAEANQAIAEARADAATEIVNDEIGEETEVTDEWLTEKFASLEQRVETMRQELANLLAPIMEQLKLLAEVNPQVKLLVEKLIPPANPQQSTPNLSEEIQVVNPANQKEKEGDDRREQETKPEQKKRRKI